MKKKVSRNHEKFSLPWQLKLVCACVSALLIPMVYWFRLHEILSAPQPIIDFVNGQTGGNSQLDTNVIEKALQPLLILVGITTSFSLYRILISFFHRFTIRLVSSA